MATVYSLLCWAGKDGKSVTGSSATTDRITVTAHGIRAGYPMAFQFTAGTLMTGASVTLALNTTYYAKYFDANDLEIYTDSALSNRITWTGAGSGLTVKSAYYQTATKSRWTYSASEYIFSSISAWRTHRVTTVPANAIDTEVLEIAGVWDDALSSVLTLNIGAALIQILPSVNGEFTDAYHDGVYGAGYKIKSSVGFGNAIDFSGFYHQMRGITVECTNSGAIGIRLNVGLYNEIANCFLIGGGTGLSQTACTAGVANTLRNNVVLSWATGLNCGSFGSGNGTLYFNNTVAKCTTGFAGSSNPGGFYYNNVAAGCTTAWQATPGTVQAAQYNGSDGGAVWGSNTITTFNATTHWVDYANNNLHPTSTNPGKDAGVTIVQTNAEDMAGDLRPNYNNGGAEAWDIGAFEYDNGFGLPPSSGTLAGSNIINGTRIKIAKQSDGTEIVNAVVSGTTKSDAYTGPNVDVYIYARKGSAAPYYKPLRISGSIVDGNLTYDLSGLQIEDIAAATYTAGVATDWTFNSTTGAITHASGTTRYSVQDLYSWHQDYYDDSATVDDNPLINGITPTQFELINNATVSDEALQYLYGGSIEFTNGALWSSLYTAGSLAASHNIYVVQDDEKLFQHWAAGHIDILVQVKA